MAKKGRTGYLGMAAFIAVILNALAWLISFICDAANLTFAINGHSIPSMLTAIASLLLLIVVIFVAHDFAERQSKFWRIVFWVLAVIAILSIFLGVGVNFFN